MLVYINHDDMRSLELMEEMVRRGYYVSDQYQDMKYADVIYLGTKGIDRKNRLKMQKDTIVLEEDFFKNIKENCLIVTLINNPEGLISYLIMHRRHPIFKSHIVVLGFGHCAKPIIEYLLALHAHVDVVVRRKELKEDIEKCGAHYVHIQDVCLDQTDILINTIPSLVIREKELENVKKGILIVDIASYPYGIDHHYALSKGLNSQILPSIPCKYAYGYAGEMIADEIERRLKNA